MTLFKNLQRLNIKTLSVLFLPIQLLFFGIISRNSEWVEEVYIKNFYKPLTLILRNITHHFDFSLGLIGIYAFVCFLLWFSIRLVTKNKKTKPLKLFAGIIALFSPIYFFYMLLWGLAYHKQPIEMLMGFNRQKIKTEEVMQLCLALIDSANTTRARLSQSDLDKLSLQKIIYNAPNGYTQIAKEFPYLKYEMPSIKKATGSTLLAYMGTSGVYMFLTGEANVNCHNVIYELPYITSHEMAHQLGFASEDEANYVAFLACSKNPDPAFQYSAYYSTVFRALNKAYHIDSLKTKSLYKKLSSQVKADHENERIVWSKFRNPFEKYLISPFYDFFLKSNGVRSGSKSYDKVVELLIAQRRRRSKPYSANLP
jgi:Protein of unknown function (DUF3810)